MSNQPSNPTGSASRFSKDTGVVDAGIAHARLETDIELLYEAGQLLGMTLDPDAVYDIMHRIISRVMDCDSLIVSQYTSGDNTIRCAYAFIEGQRVDAAQFPPLTLAPEGQGMQSHVIRTGESRLIQDAVREAEACATVYYAGSDGTMNADPGAETERTQSILMVPIKLEGHVLGAVQLMSCRQNAYTSDHLRLLEALMIQVAAASRNAVLYQQAQSEIRERTRAEEKLRHVVRSARCLLWLGTVEERDGTFQWDISVPDEDAAQQFLPLVVSSGHSYVQTFIESRLPADLKQAGIDTAEVLHSGSPGYIQEFRCRRGDGELRWLSEDVRIEPLEPGRWRLVGVCTDISERKQADEAVRESEARKGAILNAALDCIVTIDHQGNITEFNPAAERTFDYTRQEVLGREMAELIIPPSLREPHRAGMARLVAGGDAAIVGKRLEITAMRQGGEEFPAELSITRIPVEGPPTFTGFIRDVTERKTAEKETERLQAQVIQTEKLAALGELVAGVAHEINNPLAAISGNAQLMEFHDDPQVREDGRTIRRMADRATRIVRSLLTFARCHSTERRPASLATLVEATLEVCAHKVRKAGVELELRFESHGPEVLVNDNQIQQIILNLVNNAEHALRRKEGPREIVISTAVRKCAQEDVSWATISVADNGCGIPEDIRSRIFDPFFTTKDVGEGTGLGLSVCHGIAEAHGGRLSVSSTLGAGTTFTLSLPLFTAEAAGIVASEGRG